MYINSYEVTVFTNCGSDPIVFSDTTIPGSGAAAYGALDEGQDIKAYISDGNDGQALMIVPYNSVCAAQIVVGREEVEDPADETCPAANDG